MTHVDAQLEQLARGHRWLRDSLGVDRVRAAWYVMNRDVRV